MPLGPLLAVTAFALLSPIPPLVLGQGGLSAAAAASGRPAECRAGSRRAIAKGPSVWERARVPGLQRYCDLIARAHTQIGTSPAEAKKAAEEADKVLPGKSAPQVVIARAAFALGDLDGATKAFAKAREIDARSVEDPPTMRDLARVLTRTGKRDEALVIYRALVPRIDLLGAATVRVAVLLEAAHVSMAEGGALSPADIGKGKPAKPKLDEAVAYLREARQQPATQLAGDVLLSLALALDRTGERDQADAVLAEAQRTGVKLRADALDYVATPEEKLALTAIASEGSDRAAAQKSWEAFLAGPGGKGAWAAAAKSRLDLVKRGGGAKPVKAAPAPAPRRRR